MSLRKALQECKACKIKKPECGDDPPPCFPRVECRDTYDGPVCGPCPPGFKGDGRVISNKPLIKNVLLDNFIYKKSRNKNLNLIFSFRNSFVRETCVRNSHAILV